MNFRFAGAIALLFFGLAAFSPNPALSQTRLGLHVTKEELDIWKQRASSGPYRVAGDVSTNSPGDWARIQSNANSFRSNPSAERWSGQPSGSCWSWKSNPPALPSRSLGERLRDAAFRYLITGDTNDRNAVLNELLAQAGTAGTNWADSTRWNTTADCLSGDAYSWQITMWLTKLLFAYDYIRHDISSTNRTTLDTWFLNAAVLFEDNVRKTVATRYPNRLSDDYTLASGWSACTGSQSPKVLYFGGPNRCSFHEGWNNRSGSHVQFFSGAGILLNHSTLKARGKRWFEESIKYSVWADGTHQEFHRWTSTSPSLGWQYTGVSVGVLVTLADMFARNGDSSLYNFSTKIGQALTSSDTSGGPKTLKQVILTHMRHVNAALNRYGTNQSANNGNASYRIRSIDGLTGSRWIHDTWPTPANVFFNDAEIKSIYLRQASGAPGYPSSVSGGGYCVYCGVWGIYPGVLFMFGQMEGKVSPYSSTVVTAPLPESSSSPIGHWKFDEGSGTVAKDSSGTGNHGTLTNGATWTTGRSGSAVSFDGLDDFVKIATTNFSTAQGTLSLWVRAASFSSNPHNIIGHTTTPFANRIRLYVDDVGGNLDLSLGDSHSRAVNIQQLQANTWHHLALTWSSGTYAVYVDGVQRATGSYSGLSSLSSYAHIGGGGYDSKPLSWNGAIDEVKIWNRSLSATEVQNEYNSDQLLPPTSPSNVVAQPAQ